MIQEPIGVAATIAAATTLAFWLDRRVAWAGRIGATLLAIIFGALLSNLGLVPAESPVYDVVTGAVTSLAIVWLLLAIDVRELRTAGPRMLAAFMLASVATMVGTVVAMLVFGGVVGPDAWKLAGTITGTYIGGGLNFVAVGRAVEMPEALFTAAAAADNILTAVWFGATLTLPLWLARSRRMAPRPASVGVRSADGGSPVEPAHARAADGGTPEHPFFAAVPLKLVDVSVLITLGLVVLRAAELAADRVPAVPGILWLTTFGLAIAQLPPVRRLVGAIQLGSLALHFFFVVIGIGSRVVEIVRVGPEVFYFVALVVLVHGVVVYGGSWLARIDAATASVASQAAIGGPSTALALAVARDWRSLVLPGTVAGLLGYAIGTYAGVSMAYAVRGLIGG